MLMKRIVIPLCLFCGLLLLPACMGNDVSIPDSEELRSAQPSESQPLEAPSKTAAESPAESSATSDATTYLPDESSLASNIPENTTEAENPVATSSETSAVPSSSSSETSAIPQPTSPAEVFLSWSPLYRMYLIRHRRYLLMPQAWRR